MSSTKTIYRDLTDGPARLLDQTLKELGIRAQFTCIEGRTHFDLYQGGLTVKIAKEMEAVAHPKPAKPAATRKFPELLLNWISPR